MKSGISQWAFPPAMPGEEAIRKAGEIGFQTLELCVGEDETTRIDASEQDIAKLLRTAEKANVRLLSLASGLGWKYPMTSPDPKVREQAKAAMEKAMRIARWAEIDSVLVVPGIVTAEVRYDVALENAITTLHELLPLAEQLNVCMAIENVWNKFLLSPTEMRDFVDQFDSPGVGAFFDVGNIIPYGYPEQWIAILGQRIKKIHMKDFRANVGNLDGFVMLMEGDVNWPAVMQALREIGYDGPLTAEYWPYKHSLDAMLRHCKASLDAIMSL